MTRIAAIVLAAGLSSRMPGGNKLFADLGGKPVLLRTLEAIAASRAAVVHVVTGHMRQDVEKLSQQLPVTLVHNPDFACGMASSIIAGIRSLPGDIDGALVCLGDMPAVRSALIDRLISRFDARHGRSICVPVFGGLRGNPVLWGRTHFARLEQLSGDRGGKAVLEALTDQVCEVEADDEGILLDADTPSGLARLRCYFS